MDVERIERVLGADSLFSGRVAWLDTVDSTNTRLKAMAAEGAPEGAVLLAGEQTGGRGTRGRAFHSPPGGLYLSVLLRPNLPPAELLTLTGWVAVAVRDGVEAACGAQCHIKWLNDIYLGGRKLCGILTELDPAGPWVVTGVGINVTQTAGELEARGLGRIATSLALEGYAVELEVLAACVLRALEAMYRRFPMAAEDYLERYRAFCLTCGRRVEVETPEGHRQGMAVGVDEKFGLLVDWGRGPRPVCAGTVRLMEEGEERQ